MGEIATQLNGIAPNDPKLEPYFALAEELNLPTLIHTEGIGPYLSNFRSASGSPLLLEDVLVRHPKLRLFVENTVFERNYSVSPLDLPAHMGGITHYLRPAKLGNSADVCF